MYAYLKDLFIWRLCSLPLRSVLSSETQSKMKARGRNSLKSICVP